MSLKERKRTTSNHQQSKPKVTLCARSGTHSLTLLLIVQQPVGPLPTTTFGDSNNVLQRQCYRAFGLRMQPCLARHTHAKAAPANPAASRPAIIQPATTRKGTRKAIANNSNLGAILSIAAHLESTARPRFTPNLTSSEPCCFTKPLCPDVFVAKQYTSMFWSRTTCVYQGSAVSAFLRIHATTQLTTDAAY
jgi:hypothetical protein